MRKKIMPVTVMFTAITAIVIILKSVLKSIGFDINFLLIGNLILFLLSISGFLIQMRALRSANINAFIRGIYSSLLLKLFIIATAVLIYVFLNRENVNKQSLFTCMGLYFVYTIIEVKQLMKISRGKANA